MQFPVIVYLKRVFVSALYSLLLLFLFGVFIENGISGENSITLLIRLFLSGIVVLVVLYFLYLNNRERQFIIKTIQSKK